MLPVMSTKAYVSTEWLKYGHKFCAGAKLPALKFSRVEQAANVSPAKAGVQ